MSLDLDELQRSAIAEINAAAEARALEQLRVDLLGKKGRVTELLKALGGMAPDERKAFGERVNRVRFALEDALDIRKHQLEEIELFKKLSTEHIDVTLPGRGEIIGGLHPITRTIQRIERLFCELGFETVEGPEIEDDFHNFGALNIPELHPARGMHDTFYVEWTTDDNNPLANQAGLIGSRLLRTHTSSVQIREMYDRKRKPPIRIICPGRVYRSDSDRTHSPMFHQVEGLYVAENVSFADLQYDLKTFLSRFFEREVEVRFRPSYFPFTEPSSEVDIKDEKGRWLEVLGCGMVHPKVFEAVGIDPERYTGYAFGLGVERFAMLRYGVDDLRNFFNNDLRFLEQFQ